ncbi:MAG: hypothetical protein M0004_13300 [Actinomycetota bacterium]|nr:hypothetical protein [Actinomycetota bacterium]
MPGLRWRSDEQRSRVEHVPGWPVWLTPERTTVLVAVLFGAITVLRWFVDGAGQAVALLYVVPIVIAALRFGHRGGLGVAACGATAFGLLAGVHEHGDLDVTGWAGPLLAMGLAGGLVGYLTDLLAHRAAAGEALVEHSKRLEEVCSAQHAALNVSDSITQRVAAARWMLEAGRTDEAIEVLGSSVAESIASLNPSSSLTAAAPGPDGSGDTRPAVQASETAGHPTRR